MKRNTVVIIVKVFTYTLNITGKVCIIKYVKLGK